jgi:endonuclease/exonuclease/phosphatase family metal-dependent hydrolase
MIKLITLNVEQHLHLDKIVPFLEQEQAEVLCLQEIYENDLEKIAADFHYYSAFQVMTKRNNPNGLVEQSGVALLSKYPLLNVNSEYYHKPSSETALYDGATFETKRKTIAHGILWADIEKENKIYTVGVTHFTWTPNGESNEFQEIDMKALNDIIDSIPDLILCGDFNVPRITNSVYPLLTKRLKDNTPLTFKTTMDTNLHKVKNNPEAKARLDTYIVDYILTTPKYKVHNMRQKFGISDHTALIADIE